MALKGELTNSRKIRIRVASSHYGYILTSIVAVSMVLDTSCQESRCFCPDAIAKLFLSSRIMGTEPATVALSAQHSNQLSYVLVYLRMPVRSLLFF